MRSKLKNSRVERQTRPGSRRDVGWPTINDRGLRHGSVQRLPRAEERGYPRPGQGAGLSDTPSSPAFLKLARRRRKLILALYVMGNVVMQMPIVEHPRSEKDDNFLSRLAEWASLSMTALAVFGFLSTRVFDTNLSSIKIFDVGFETIAPILAFVIGAFLAYVIWLMLLTELKNYIGQYLPTTPEELYTIQVVCVILFTVVSVIVANIRKVRQHANVAYPVVPGSSMSSSFSVSAG